MSVWFESWTHDLRRRTAVMRSTAWANRARLIDWPLLEERSLGRFTAAKSVIDSICVICIFSHSIKITQNVVIWFFFFSREIVYRTSLSVGDRFCQDHQSITSNLWCFVPSFKRTGGKEFLGVWERGWANLCLLLTKGTNLRKKTVVVCCSGFYKIIHFHQLS